MEERTIDEIHEKYREWRKIYDKDPIYALLISVFDDLKLEGLKDNITISSIEGALPTRLTEIPDWLKGDAKVLRDQIVDTLYLDVEEEYAFCVVLETGTILYIYHFEGTGDYDCCQSLRIYYTTAWQLLLPHILPVHMNIKHPKNTKI